ncbi:transcription initiation factor TFIID subunit 4-like [Panicum virgatum]|uniref:transcription initiation factor TFIID subunit 4-like n=1 Tax=Panicum virgatum TaxID=38727 RepID=UPI0019D57DF0|nr:transcription initiation factor TFIID subunit 4-like [Panicum virgatum]
MADLPRWSRPADRSVTDMGEGGRTDEEGPTGELTAAALEEGGREVEEVPPQCADPALAAPSRPLAAAAPPPAAADRRAPGGGGPADRGVGERARPLGRQAGGPLAAVLARRGYGPGRLRAQLLRSPGTEEGGPGPCSPESRVRRRKPASPHAALPRAA